MGFQTLGTASPRTFPLVLLIRLLSSGPSAFQDAELCPFQFPQQLGKWEWTGDKKQFKKLI